MGSVEYVIRGDDGKPYRHQYQFNTTEELANLIDLSTLLTVDEIVGVILAEMEDDDVEDLTALTYSELITLHQTAGREIRNAFGLWIEDNPNIEDHPDDTSMVILERCWLALKKDATTSSQKMTF